MLITGESYQAEKFRQPTNNNQVKIPSSTQWFSLFKIRYFKNTFEFVALLSFVSEITLKLS